MDIFSRKTRSRVMAAIHSRGNRNTELRFAEILRRNGITGWRRHQRLAGSPDFAFPAFKLAVFIDGCFWHGCPVHGRRPQSNRNYWLPKLARNRARDKATTKVLRRKGWLVIRIWEHELPFEKKTVRRFMRALHRTLEIRRSAGSTRLLPTR